MSVFDNKEPGSGRPINPYAGSPSGDCQYNGRTPTFSELGQAIVGLFVGAAMLFGFLIILIWVSA